MSSSHWKLFDAFMETELTKNGRNSKAVAFWENLVISYVNKDLLSKSSCLSFFPMSIKERQDCFKKQKSVPSCRTQWLVAFRVVLGNAVSRWGPREMWGCGLPRTGTKIGHSVWACCRPAGSRPGLAGR